MERLKGMLYGAFIGDAFALGTHWIYDTEKLKIESSRVEHYVDPTKNIFHMGKRKGDFTHYGDQSLLLLKSIASNKGFDINIFKTHWITYMNKYEGYLDHATKESLHTLDPINNLGSSSDELGGISRIAPLIFYHFDDVDLPRFIKEQTQLTHNHTKLIEFGIFFEEWILDLIIGKPLIASLEQHISEHPSLRPYYDIVKSRLDEDSISVVKDIGQSCSSQFAFPSAIYLILKNQTDFMKAMQENILSGGDSAGRGMLIGMVLGASLGIRRIPKHLIDELNEKSVIENFSMHRQI
jgi:ADP-ribosylglycohydrolase